MHEDRRRQRFARGKKDRGPVDRVEADDPLADHMQPLVALAPPLAKSLALVGVVERGDVVRERVEPDVDHLAGVARHGDAPAVGAFGRTGDAEVGQTAPDEREHLVAAVLRLDLQTAAFDQIEQSLLVVGETEEPVALDDQLGRLPVFGAETVDQIVGSEECFAAAAVEALVVALVEIARLRRTTATSARHPGGGAGRCSCG